MIDLRSKTKSELEALAVEWGEPAYRGRQLFKWIHEKGVSDVLDMTDLPAGFRDQLAETVQVGTLKETRRQASVDGTVKCLFELPSGNHVESVLIPDLDPDGTANRLTACVSSQVGCAMGCVFCATGQMGFHENLSAGHIADQARALDDIARETYGHGLTNVVFMGMGEPMQNYAAVRSSLELLTEGLGLSPKRITVSTVGLARRIRQLADDIADEKTPPVRLAVSLHAPTDVQRSAIMPVNRSEKTDLAALRSALEHFFQQTGQAVTYEYCLFSGNNDRGKDAENLAAVCNWVPCKVNLIVYNPVEGTGFEATPESQLNRFVQILVAAGVRVTVRRSRGQDIDAACGQLAVAEGMP